MTARRSLNVHSHRMGKRIHLPVRARENTIRKVVARS